MNNIKWILLAGFFISCTVMFGQQGYEIDIKINHLSDKDVYLGYHFGEKLFVQDTTHVDMNGRGTFSGTEKLPEGLYLIFLPSQKYFDILVPEDQYFYIENDTAAFLENYKIKNSELNQAFFEYQKYLNTKQKEAQNLKKQKQTLQKAGGAQEEIDQINQKLKNIDQEVKSKRKELMEKHDNTFLATFLEATMEIDVPEPPRDEDGNITDSSFQYRYYKKHFFDHIDFSDHRLLRTPFYEQKLKRYLTFLPQRPDSLIPALDRVIQKSQQNDKVYQFTLSYFFNHYLKSKIMGMDKVYVHLADKYYLAGKAPWAKEAFLKKLEDRVEKIRPNLIGNKAPDMKLLTDQGQYASLHETDAKITILIFWEPDCGHCKKVIPKLWDLYEEYADKGLGVYAVYTQKEQEEWKEFIHEKDLHWTNVWDPYNASNFRKKYDIYSTPTIYILNEDKEIVAKRISAKDMKRFVENELAN